MRAVDLYSGVGGWSLGLTLAGVEVVESYEWWDRAVETHNRNHARDGRPVDVRKMVISDLPKNIDLVVGSPPCTEFSYSNRGGSGDLEEGLKDLIRFFEVVDHLRPKFWVLENVPRVADVLRKGFADKHHPLFAFRHLLPASGPGKDDFVQVFDMSDFGVPQARKRCIAGNIPFDRLRSYSPVVGRRTLGDVTGALSEEVVVDPVWEVSLSRGQLTEMETEAYLNTEELRMNREAKLYHPVYNNMSFPDELGSPARTVTATCTRVSRESIVIVDPLNTNRFRRLTVRERASLQGFPITYQFYGKRFSEKAKMVGNAIPPPFTYLVASAVQEIEAGALRSFADAGKRLALPQVLPRPTQPDEEGRTFPENRRFRAALPNLRFKSGMRFDLSNDFSAGSPQWKVRFYFGPSKEVRQIELDHALAADLYASPLVALAMKEHQAAFDKAIELITQTNPELLQQAWTKRAVGVGPFLVTDVLGVLADAIHTRLVQSCNDVTAVEDFVVAVAAADGADRLPSIPKLKRNALRILSGLVIGAWFNELRYDTAERAAAAAA